MGLFATAATLLLGAYQNRKASKREDKKAEADRANMVRDRENTFTDLRDAAERGGFNPLTALGATGGAGFGSGSSSSGVAGAAPLVGNDMLARGIQGVDDLFTGKEALDRESQRLANDLARAELAEIGKPSVNTRSNVSQRRPRLAPNDRAAPIDMRDPTINRSGPVRPVSRPTLHSQGTVPVFSPTGNVVHVSSRAAERLKINAWDVLIAEDYEAVLGDVGSEVVTVPALPNISQQIFGWPGNQSVQERQGAIDQPMNPMTLFPGFLPNAGQPVDRRGRPIEADTPQPSVVVGPTPGPRRRRTQ